MTTTRRKKTNPDPGDRGATTGYESQLWQMADALRGSMDASDYKHVVLGLLFLKYVSDAFEEARAELEAEVEEGADPEEQDEYTAKNVFWVPQEARWDYLRSQAREPTIGSTVDDAMSTIEGANPSLKDVLPKDYGLPSLDKRVIGQLIDMISDIEIGDRESRSKDVLGRVYEYFLSQFASAEGKRGGEFYTPRCIVNYARWRCWSRTVVGFTIRVVGRRGCSCSRSGLSRNMRLATGTVGRLRPTYRSSVKSRTTRRGDWRR